MEAPEVWLEATEVWLEAPEAWLVGGRTDGRTYVRTYGRTDSPYSTGLCLLRFPPEPLPCSHNCYHYKILEQGKGTDDHLLPLGDWFFIFWAGKASHSHSHFSKQVWRYS